MVSEKRRNTSFDARVRDSLVTPDKFSRTDNVGMQDDGKLASLRLFHPFVLESLGGFSDILLGSAQQAIDAVLSNAAR